MILKHTIKIYSNRFGIFGKKYVFKTVEKVNRLDFRTCMSGSGTKLR